ncbi:MAG TPA: DNA-directed RNA polymerase subunit beta' [Deltaproteobacteria bacterium]|nr:DNA-directed RNA polymerase subunit beta' [Deltaproteobacteria bacterium]HOI08612.1 DNA-directed RNA polymerase subunit beta' [Deltaproteobacteria bacterium]
MEDLYSYFEKPKDPSNYMAVRIGLASPEKILAWSYGEVKKPETINYRTFKPERDGLFCARIFGPIKSYECICGKYKRMKHRGVVCEKCGVEVIDSRVRRERLGHIELATPVAHIWFLKSLPSKIGALLDLSIKELERVLYFESYIVTDPKDTPLKKCELLTEDKFRQCVDKHGIGSFTAKMGAEAVDDLIKDLDILEISNTLKEEVKNTKSEAKKKKLSRRLRMVNVFKGIEPSDLMTFIEDRFHLEKDEQFRRALGEILTECRKIQKRWEEAKSYNEKKEIIPKVNEVIDRLIDSRRLTHDEVDYIKPWQDPSWMILKVIPVLPPDLRPLVPLDGGRFATSDLNDLYRRVINRNNRLKRLMELNAPDIILRNEKRMLQEAVDVLFDNGRRGRVITGANRRPLKSLSDMLKGKQGRFRQNLLGKRVDYSGRSVITAGPDLRLHQCGLPKKMAIELFKPFIYNRLENKGYVSTIKSAKRLVEAETPEVWECLAEVVQEYPVMLNRAPTLHRLGIQAFEPILIEGKAIQLHPLVCPAFNADFDGDQMAVHVPLSIEAQVEARVLMMSTNNILSPAHGKPIIVPTQDIVLGVYYLTRERPMAKGEGMIFFGPEEVRAALDAEVVDIQAKIKVRMNGKYVDTTVGRIVFSEIVPEEIPFATINKPMTKKALADIVDVCFRVAGDKKTVLLADRIKDLGYHYATKAGISIGIEDMKIPASKPEIIGKAKEDVAQIITQYNEGLITDGERYNKIVDIWTKVTDHVAADMMDTIKTDTVTYPDGRKEEIPSFNPIFMMADSGARGSAQQIRQLAGIRGLMAKPSGEIIETPIESNFREGLDVLEYFISTHGARKGLADTALKTANSGYLTRRLVDVAHDVVITEEDCGTLDGIEMRALVEGGEIIQTLGERLLGRVALDDIRDPYSGEVLVAANTMIDESHKDKIEDAGLEHVVIRSALSCRSKHGICAKCYGKDLARGRMVNIGEAVGIIAAQSIGEPGTQLTMRTFHIGGTATVVEQSSIKFNHTGIVRYKNLKTVQGREGEMVVMNRNGGVALEDENGRERETYSIVYGARVKVPDGARVEPGQMLAEWDPYSIPILTDVGGRVKFNDLVEEITMQEHIDEVTGLSRSVVIEPKDPELRPRILITDDSGKVAKIPDSKNQARYNLPVGANLFVKEGDEVYPGDVLVKIPRETTKTKDITGGLPRVVELFEARRPKECATVTEIDGEVSYGKDSKGKRKVIITPEVGQAKEYMIPKTKHISVLEGDFVRAGEPLMDGAVDPHDILRISGEKDLARYLVNEVQEVYRLQGVRINDKHIEVIVRQMLKRVRIKDAGDTSNLEGEYVDKYSFDEENERVVSAGGRPAIAEGSLLGITKASLNTESFISAASFQETTRVLTEASVEGKVDHLVGLKENVIMGRLIPAGTGFPVYNRVDIKVEEEDIFDDEL